MATIENYIRLRDGFSPVLERMSRASDTVSDKLDRVAGSARTAGDAAEGASSKFSVLKDVFAGSFLATAATAALNTVREAVEGIVGTADEYAGLQSRLALIAGSAQNVAYLNDQIYASARRARGGYMEMAGAVAQLSQSAHDAFPDPRQTVDFIEGIQKLFVIGGASKEAQKDAMLQLTQGLASGQLQGDEFRSIAENAPIIENMIAKQMGVTRGELKQLASEGKVTADVIKSAVLDNMDEINAQFDTMPKKWGDHFTELSNTALQAFSPVLVLISDIANSYGVRYLVDAIKNGISDAVPFFMLFARAAQASINFVADTFAGAVAFFQSHSLALNAVLIVVGAALGFVALNAAVSAGQMALATAATVAKAAADWLETAAVIAMIFAQEGLNAALYACPVTWIIGAIVALIAVFYLAVAVVNNFAGTSISATGIIFAAFTVLFTGIGNLVKLAGNMFVAFANFLGSVFQDPLGAAYNLFVDIWNAIVDFVGSAVNSIIDLVNKIPGMDKVANFGHVDMPTIQRKEIANAAFHIEPFTYGNAMQNAEDAYDFGAGLGAKIGEMMKPPASEKPDGFDASVLTPGAAAPKTAGDKVGKDSNKKLGDIRDNTARIADKIDMTDTEIRDMKDAALQQTMVDWQNQHVVVNIENNNSVASDYDVDGITSNMVEGLRSAFMTSREGANP